jgi:hypothetical protein
MRADDAGIRPRARGVREFSKGSFRLRDAPGPLRAVYGGFLLLTAVGLVSQLGFQVGRVGLTPAAVAVYYRGSDGGDVLAFPKTAGQLLEVTHAHAFTMALVLLVLAHLFVATGMSARTKGLAVLLAFSGTCGGLAAPWMVRYVSPAFAMLTLLSWLAQAVGMWTMLGVSAYECLGRGRPVPR